MTSPKLHHHLPQSYQEGFCHDGRIVVFDRVTGRFRRDQPKNVAAITHDYTIYRDGGVKDTRVEAFFARIDGTAVPIAKKLRAGVSLTADERQSFAWYLAYFAARVPRFERWLNEHETATRKLFDREHLRSPAQLQEVIDKAPLTGAERAGANAELMFQMLKSEEYTVAIDHNGRVKVLVEAGIDLMPKVHDLFWIVGHASDGSEFITTDNPLFEDSTGTLVTFPLAADTALLMMPMNADRRHNYDKDVPAEIVHATNLAAARASERLVLGRNESYLERVVAEAGITDHAPAPLVDIGPPRNRS
jgi:hypothetical protein